MGPLRYRLPSVLAAAFSLCALAGAAHAQAFPSKPVRIIVQTAAGASIDVAARIVAENLGRRWGQQVVVINQPGAGGALAARALAAAPNDGHTLFFAASSVFVVLPELQKALAADVAAFVPVAFVGETPMAVTVSARAGLNSLSDLIALARNTPGGVNCGVSTRGGLSHLSAEMLRDAAKMDMTFIHYPGTAQSMTDVMAERIPVVVDSISAFLGPAAGGQLKILAVASPSRLKAHPDIPTVAETLPGFDATAWFVFVAPPGTPADLAARIGNDVEAVMQGEAVKAKLEEVGTFARTMSPPELRSYLDVQKAKWAPVVRRVGE